MNPTTVLRGILQKLKMTITWSLEANFFTELDTKFFSWLKICFERAQNISDCHRNIRNAKKIDQEFYFLHM